VSKSKTKCKHCGKRIVQDTAGRGWRHGETGPYRCCETFAEPKRPAAPSSASPEGLRETGWLIEREGAEWFTGRTWTRDSAKAVRFASREDAQHTIDLIRFDSAAGIKPTEHIWS
jgi:hypothetical protein